MNLRQSGIFGNDQAQASFRNDYQIRHKKSAMIHLFKLILVESGNISGRRDDKCRNMFCVGGLLFSREIPGKGIKMESNKKFQMRS